MMLERQIGGALLRIECAGRLAPAGRNVLDELERIAGKGATLGPGWRMRLGWSLLMLASDSDGALRLCEPDYERTPLTGMVPTLDWTLDVIAAQTRVARRVGVTPVDVAFDDDIAVRRGALDSTRVALLRSPPVGEHDSGWFAAAGKELDASPADDSAEQPGEDALERLPVYRLVTEWPLVLSVHVLPVGFSVELGRQHVVNVWDEKGHARWESRARST